MKFCCLFSSWSRVKLVVVNIERRGRVMSVAQFKLLYGGVVWVNPVGILVALWDWPDCGQSSQLL